jgi:SAM-dependent methyltransferase
MYTEFSRIYDRLINADYKKFFDYYKRIFEKFNIDPKLVLDIGCGTGTLTGLFHGEGYDMIGIDRSPDMLDVAKKKNHDILYLNQDMTRLELYGTVDAMYSSLDCINYILDESSLARFFSLVNNYLNYGGLYVFDISSFYKLSEVLGNNTFVFECYDIFYVWENCFEDDLLTMNLTFFEKKGSLYKKITETQTQRAYKVHEITTFAENAGLEVLGVFDEFSFKQPSEKSERIFFVLRRRTK